MEDLCAGGSEFCPACGALNDVPRPDSEGEVAGSDEAPIVPPVETAASPAAGSRAAGRGVPSGLWWATIICAIGAFVVICFFLFSGNWESQNVQSLADAVNRGDALAAGEDFAGAARAYRSVAERVGTRPIQSTFILQLIQHARMGEREAEAQLRLAASKRPPTSQAASPAANVTTQPAIIAADAVRDFQRDSEGFAQFVRSRPTLFRDDRGFWRGRQLTVWDISYEEEADSDPRRITLHYSFNARMTEPHDARAAAADDPRYVDPLGPSSCQCQTLFELGGGTWRILHRQVDDGRQDADAANPADAGPPDASALAELRTLEGQAFHARVAQGESR